MGTTLCLDFGNTRLKAGIFSDDELNEIIFLEPDPIEALRNILLKYRPAKSILSSVIDHNKDIITMLNQETKFHLLSHASHLLFTIPAGKPETVGTDRLAIAAAVVKKAPGANNLAIGLGTCITYNFINAQHEFMGGAISPGMDMRFKALNHYTAKLPWCNRAGMYH